MADKNAKILEELRKGPRNKICMDCNEKVICFIKLIQGTTYIVGTIGIFVCSRCAGLHREIGHKVKGISMCVFNNDEIEFLKKWGNENAAKTWLATFKKSAFSEDDMKDTRKLKEFIKNVYQQKRYYKNQNDSESDSDSDSEEDRKKKKPKAPPVPPPEVHSYEIAQKKQNKRKQKAETKPEPAPISQPKVDLLLDMSDPIDDEPKEQNVPASAPVSKPSAGDWNNFSTPSAPATAPTDALAGLSLNTPEESMPPASDPFAGFSAPVSFLNN